ncbi:hypothetical protein B566_EDAN001156 [Ephemera danica]|nr:hypothetical protein B566_EDAN001156 [Ephemera danica]
MFRRLALGIPRNNASLSGFDQCRMYAAPNFTKALEMGLREPDPQWPTVSCLHGWEFNHSEIPYATVTSEMEWVCENDSLATWAQAIFFLGAIMGGLLFGWIADRYGRIPALVGTNVVGFVAGIATPLVSNFWEFALCRFIVGFAFDNCFTMMYILVLEYVGPSRRTFVANMSIAIYFTMATVLMPWMAYFISNWRLFCVATSAPLILAVLTPWIVPESARWLVSQGKVDQAIEIMKKFERINRKKLDPQIYEDFRDSCRQIQKEEEEERVYSVLDLFKTPRMRRVTLLLIVICEMFCAASATLAIMGRFSVNISYNIGLQYAAELLPTVVRAQGVALIHIMGYVAAIVSPFVVYLGNVSPALPFLVLGGLAIIGGILSLFLPETLNHELPQTLQDGEDFGKDQEFFEFPCCGKKTYSDEVNNMSQVGRSTFYRAGADHGEAFVRRSQRASTRGEAFRSSMIQRASMRHRSSKRVSGAITSQQFLSPPEVTQLDYGSEEKQRY